MFADLPIVMGPSLYAQCSGGSPPAGGGGGHSQRTHYVWQTAVPPNVCSADSVMQEEVSGQKKEHGIWVWNVIEGDILREYGSVGVC